MSKGSQGKSKAKKEKRPPPSWREQLAELDVNRACGGRTCQVILMAELTLSFSEAVALFHAGARKHPSHVVKSINREDLIQSLEENKPETEPISKPTKQQSKSDKPPTELLQLAAKEAKELLCKGEALPTELTAQILKIKIIQMAFEDVLLRNEERRLEEQPASPPPDTNTSKKAKGKQSNTCSNLAPEERLLYILLNGFYDPDLPKQLFNVGAPLSAVLEISNPESAHRERYVQSRIAAKSRSLSSSQLSNPSSESVLDDEEVHGEEMVLFVNPYYQISKNSLCFSMFSEQNPEQEQTSCLEKCSKIEALYNFWNALYKGLDGECSAEFLQSTAHVRIFPRSAFLNIETKADPDDKRAESVFWEISKEILKFPDIQKRHTNYLQHLKLTEIEPQLKDLSVETTKTYSKLINAVPLDCFTIELFVDYLIEEVSAICDRQSNMAIDASNSLSNTNESVKSSQEVNILAEKRTELANYVLNYRKMHFPFLKSGLICCKDNRMNPKKHLKLVEKYSPIYERNELEFKMNSYQQLSSNLLKINLNFLRLSIPILMWQLHPSLKPIEVIYRNHQLQTWNQATGISLEKIKRILNILECENTNCSKTSNDIYSHEGVLQGFLPKKDYSEILRAGVPKVKYIETPNMSITSATEKESCVEIPQHRYENHPNIYEAKNISAYLWHEKLSPAAMLQCLKQANSKFACLDHKYCPYTDCLILRYHNDVDEFGVNCELWSQSIRTPVCFRDFCKYMVHEESKWLEREEDKPKQGTEKPEENIDQSDHTLPHLESEETPNIIAYNLGETRLQLTETTTQFHSMDGYSVTVDRAKLLGDQSKLSLNLSVQNHNLILHYCRKNPKDPLMFHFCLEDGTTIVFAKPPRLSKPEVTLLERTWKRSATRDIPKNSAYQPRTENYCYVTEEKYCRFKETQAPNVASKSLFLPRRFVLSYLEKLKNLNLRRPFKLKRKSKKKRKRESKEVFTLYRNTNMSDTSLGKNKKIGMSLENLENLALKSECEQVLEQLREAKHFQVPLYKICSTKLHQFKYAKPTKSHVLVKVGKHSISLPRKHPHLRMTKRVQIVKAFPIKLSTAEFTSEVLYDLKLSLPSGLLLYTTAGVDKVPFNVKQRYIEKGPQFKEIADEYSRSFLRTGQVVIRRNDGSLVIYSANGQIVHCEIPYSTVRTRIGCRLKMRAGKFKYEKLLCRSIHRKRKHTIGSANKHRKGFMKKRGLCFTTVSHDGKVVKVVNSKVKKVGAIYQNFEEDTYHRGYTLERDDGTLSVLCPDGLLITHFGDQTRITSWFCELADASSCSSDSSIMSAFKSSARYLDLEDWVIVEMFYKYEHPKYASVMMNSDKSETEIRLPNDVVLNVTDGGNYFVDINGAVSSIVSDEMVYVESSTCDSCMQRNITILNVHPLYKGSSHIPESTELLKTCDSYEKIFVVNYGGRCFRNSNFINNRLNRAECQQHDREDYQQLFVLNRDLSGSKLCDIKAFRRRMVDATDDCNSVIQCYRSNATKRGYTSVEVRTSRQKPYHEYFINRKLLKQIRSHSPFPHFTTFFHLYSLPNRKKLNALRLLTVDHHEKHMEFPRSDTGNVLCKCTHQISKENFELRERLKSDLSEADEVSSALSASKKWWSWYESNESLALRKLTKTGTQEQLVTGVTNRSLSEIRERISSIKRWSESVIYPDNLYVLAENSVSVSEVFGSISDWLFRSKSMFSYQDLDKEDAATSNTSYSQKEEETNSGSLYSKHDSSIESGNTFEEFYNRVVDTEKIYFENAIQVELHMKNLYQWIKGIEHAQCGPKDKCEDSEKEQSMQKPNDKNHKLKTNNHFVRKNAKK